jgi:hypothetical protein
MTKIDRHGVAARLRSLLQAVSFEAAALQLDVSELALRISIDTTSPNPTIDVIVAAARHFAVDPTWILTGEYDRNTHHVALDGNVDDVARAMQRMLAADAFRFAAELPSAELPPTEAGSERQTSSN